MSGNLTVGGRVELRVGGMVITQFQSVSIERDLRDMAGRFECTLFDQARVAGAGTDRTFAAAYSFGGTALPLVAGMAFTMLIDGAPVMVGNIDAPKTHWNGKSIGTVITGRDKTGDLVDCAAIPYGPAEFKNVDLLHVAMQLCKPFGIPVRADIDVGAPFVRLAMGPHETVLAALEKAARQRAALLVSDGIGGLLITQGGKSRAPAPLVLGGNVVESTATRSWERRFSDYFVKGQTEKANGGRKGLTPHLDATVVPFTAGGGAGKSAPAPTITPEASAILMTGHAIDPEITRWRPTVRMTRSQSGMSTTQEQAEWALRVARGEGDQLEYTVLDWRAAPADATGTLWLPNQVAAVFDPVALLNQDMLIAGCKYRFDETGGLRTTMRVVGVTAYDRINEAARKSPRIRGKKTTGPLSSAVVPLTAP